MLTYLVWSVNYRKNPEKTIFENATSRHANFTKFAGLSPLTSEINPENFRSISQRLAILQNNL